MGVGEGVNRLIEMNTTEVVVIGVVAVFVFILFALINYMEVQEFLKRNDERPKTIIEFIRQRSRKNGKPNRNKALIPLGFVISAVGVYFIDSNFHPQFLIGLVIVGLVTVTLGILAGETF